MAQLRDELDRLVEKAMPYGLPAIIHEIREVMAQRFEKDAEYDIAVEDNGRRQVANLALWDVARCLWDKGLVSPAAQLLTDYWDTLGERQRQNNHHIYRAMAAGLAGQCHHKAGNFSQSFRWSLLAHADDILDGHGEGGGLARDMLLGVFGMNETGFARFSQIAQDSQRTADSEGWRAPVGFAEDVLQRYIKDIDNGAYAEQISSLTSVNEFPLSKPYFAALVQEVRIRRDKGQETIQGKKLEDAAMYLFSLLPGCIPMATIHDVFEAFTFDVVVTNVFHAPNLLSDLFGRHIVAECKNWQTPVDVRRVGYFLHTARTVHAKLAVMFSRQGTTGGEQERNATSLMKRAYNEDGIIAIVFTDADLTRLQEGKVGFLWLLLQKADEQRFGRRGS